MGAVQRGTPMRTIITATLAALAGALLTAFILAGRTSADAAAAPVAAATAPDPFATVRAAVGARLRDPDSARFGEFRRGTAGATCGAVNARNGFGGYTGLQPFVLPPAGPLYLYDESLPWIERGRLAARLEQWGCPVAGDAADALRAHRARERFYAERR